MSRFVRIQERIINLESVTDAEMNPTTNELKPFCAAGSITIKPGDDADRLWAMLCRMSRSPDDTEYQIGQL